MGITEINSQLEKVKQRLEQQREGCEKWTSAHLVLTREIEAIEEAIKKLAKARSIALIIQSFN